jgi:hypothetical protein
VHAARAGDRTGPVHHQALDPDAFAAAIAASDDLEQRLRALEPATPRPAEG